MFKVAHLYILKLSNETYYTGITSNLTRRMIEHSKGVCKSTKYHRPFIIRHTEQHQSMSQARKKEKFVKNRGAEKYLLDLKYKPFRVSILP